MSKKIVERPRYGGGKEATRRNRHAAKRDPENTLQFRSVTKLHLLNWGGKELNENLNPLYRFLNKQAGRKWDDVYSEMCEQIKLSSACQLHILQHVDDFVEKNVIIVGGIPCTTSFRGMEPIASWDNNGSYTSMYVDPRDGILRMSPSHVRSGVGLPWKARLRGGEKAPFQDRIDNPKDILRKWLKIDGLWYEVEFEKVSEESIAKRGYYDYVNHYDVVFKESFFDIWDLKRCYGSLLVAVKKRQLNSKEIKKLPIAKTAA